MRIAQTVFGNRLADIIGQTHSHARGQITVAVKQRKRPLFTRQCHAGPIGGIPHLAGDIGGKLAGLEAVIAQAEHDQRIAKTGKTKPDAALVGGLRRLFL